jgi:propanol-preferring alcohol dehydrogenase
MKRATATPTTSYRAVHVAAEGTLATTEPPVVEPSAEHLRIGKEACGIRRGYSAAVHRKPADHIGRLPGHEAVGRIDPVGQRVTGWTIGDRVGVGFTH